MSFIRSPVVTSGRGPGPAHTAVGKCFLFCERPLVAEIFFFCMVSLVIEQVS